MLMLDSPRGSNPTSPGIVPSSFSGCGMNGMDLLFTIMLIPADVEVVRASGTGAMNAEALATSAVNTAIGAFISLYDDMT